MIKAIVFDCFGVLVTDALQSIVDEVQNGDPEKAERIIGLVKAAMSGKMDSDASRSAIAAELGLTLPEYSAKMAQAEVKNYQLLAYIQTLKGNYKIGLLSNVLKGGLTVRFTPGELMLFDVVAASGEIGYSKSDAQAYEYAAEKLGVRLDECIMIDDRPDYCAGAQAVGMSAIQYESFAQMQQELEHRLA